MNKGLVGAVILSMALCAPALKSAQAAEKIGYVDLSRVFTEYGKTKQYDKSFDTKKQSAQAEVEKMFNDIKAFEDKMNLASDKEKEAKKGEYEAKIKAFEKLRADKEADLRKDELDKTKEILKDIEAAVKQYAVKEGYTLVFNDRVLIYESKNMDITDQIIAILNVAPSKK